MTTQVRFRMMVSIPIFRNNESTLAANLMSAMIPMFWIDSHTLLKDHMYSTMYNTFVRLPKAMDISKIVTLAVALLCFVIAFWCLFRSRGGHIRRRNKQARQNDVGSSGTVSEIDKRKNFIENSEEDTANEPSGSGSSVATATSSRQLTDRPNEPPKPPSPKVILEGGDVQRMDTHI